MTITTDQAIALARESIGWSVPLVLDADELTEYANKVRTQTLLEAADLARGETWANHSAYVVLEKLRRMAGVE